MRLRHNSPLCMSAILFIIAILLSISGGCASKNGAKPAGTLDPSLQKISQEVDSQVDKEIDEGTAAEAREWLSSESHGFWNESSVNIKDIVEKYYAAGAPKVYVTGVADLQGKKVSASIAVELPSDKAAREKIFKADESISTELNEEPEKDVGQKYLQRAFD